MRHGLRITVRIIFLCAFSLSCCGCASWGQVHEPPPKLSSLPEFPGAIELPYSHVIHDLPAGSPHASRYAPTISKSDTVIVGEQIRIDSGIRTNGGDVLVLADKVELCAAIDTRVYIDHSSDDVQGSSGQCLSASTYYEPDFGPPYKQSNAGVRLSEYYGRSRPLWDDETKSWIVSESNTSAELPGGITACAIPGKSSSAIPFPDEHLKRDAFRSGNITIITRSLSVCSKLASAEPPNIQSHRSDFPECGAIPRAELPFPSPPVYPIHDTTLLMADGAYGGRPGLPLRGCREHGPSNPSCRTLAVPKTRPGTAGADAGDVRLFLIGASDQQEQHSLLMQRASTLGGASYALRLHEKCPSFELTPNPACPQAGFLARCGLINTPPPHNQLFGSDGLTELKSVSTSDAIIEFAASLMEIEKKADHDFEKQLEALAPLGFVETGTTSDILSAYLEISLQRANQRLSEAALGYFRSGVQPVGRFLPEILDESAVDIEQGPSPVITPEQKTLLLRVEELRSMKDHDALAAYLTRSGGLLWNSDPHPAQTLQRIQLLQAIGELQISLQELTKANVDLHIDFYKWTSDQERLKFQNLINDIATRLAKAEEEAKKTHKFDKIIGQIEKIVDLAKEAIENYKSFQYHKMAKPIVGIVRSIQEIEEIWKSDPTNSINELRALLASSIAALDSFNREVEQRKRVLLERKSDAVSKALAASSRYYSLARQARVLHGDLQRQSIATLLSSRENYGGAMTRFENTQSLLVEFAGSYPAKVVVFSDIDSFDYRCKPGDISQKFDEVINTPTPLECVKGLPQLVPTVWRIKDDSDEALLRPFRGIPLFSFRAGGPSGSYSLHKLIRGNQIEQSEFEP